jgi:outer membrane protein insertion porin family
VLINLKEAPTGSLMFGVGVNSDTGLGGSISVNERNFDLFRLPTSWSDLWSGGAFRGAGQDLQIQAVPGTQLNRYSVTLTEPRLLGTTYSLSTSGYYYNRIFSNYTEERGGGRVTLGKSLTKEIFASVTMKAEEVTIYNPALPAPQDLTDALGGHFLYGPRVAINHHTWDSQLAPTKGHFVEASFEETLGDYVFPKWDLLAKQFFTLYSRRDGSGKQVLALRAEVAWTGDNTPIFERFYAGGFQSLRGFAFRGIGPVSFDQKIGGNFMVLSGAEYYMPLSADDNLGWVVFSDQGTVESKVEILNYRVTAGFGLRVKVPGMGPAPLAFDFAFPVVKTGTDDRQLFSFFIGIFR